MLSDQSIIHRKMLACQSRYSKNNYMSFEEIWIINMEYINMYYTKTYI